MLAWSTNELYSDNCKRFHTIIKIFLNSILEINLEKSVSSKVETSVWNILYNSWNMNEYNPYLYNMYRYILCNLSGTYITYNCSSLKDKYNSCSLCRLFPLKNYEKGITQNTCPYMLNHMPITKRLFFRLMRRSAIGRFCATFWFKSNGSWGFKSLTFEKILRLKKNYGHFLFVHKNYVT